MSNKQKANIGALDFETDPFKRGRLPKPFIAGLLLSYDKGKREEYKLFEDLEGDFDKELERLIIEMGNFEGVIYAHNGGRFDFIFILRKMIQMGIPVLEFKMIKNRVAKVRYRNVTLLDSFLLLPVPLKSTGEKLDFEYWKTEASYEDLTEEEKQTFEKDYKEKIDEIKLLPVPINLDPKRASPRKFYIKECRVYLKQDCKGLLDTIVEFIKLYGFGLTLAGRAFNAIKETEYSLPRVRGKSYSSHFGTYDESDKFFRKFFYGGRVQCFEKGKIEGDLHYYDINSAYPFAMTKPHWYGDCDSFYYPDPSEYKNLTKVEKETSMYKIRCHSFGAFPVRSKEGAICFPEREGVFNVTGYELAAAKKLKLVSDLEILAIYTPLKVSDIGKFVRQVHKRKQKADKEGNKTQRLIHKLVMNSGYGRFAIDSRDWKENEIVPCGEIPFEPKDSKLPPWELSLRIEELGIDVYEREIPEARRMFHSVATAASITGYVRAMLLNAIHSTERPLYCDTDSMVCVGKAKLNFGPKLGQWEEEAKGNEMHIVAKKIYAFKNGDEWKTASKGVKLEPSQIIEAAKGKTVKWSSIAPTYNFMRYPSEQGMQEMVKENESDDFRKVFIERSVSMKEDVYTFEDEDELIAEAAEEIEEDL